MTQILNDYQYTPNQQVALLALLRIHGEKIETNQSSPLDTHRWLKNVTQHHLLRKGERWDGINQEKEKRLLEAAPQIEQISQLFGMHEYLRPPQSVHQHIAIIPGATEARVKCRLNLLKQSMQKVDNRPKSLLLLDLEGCKILRHQTLRIPTCEQRLTWSRLC